MWVQFSRFSYYLSSAMIYWFAHTLRKIRFSTAEKVHVCYWSVTVSVA